MPKLKVSVTIEFSELDRRIIAVHQSDEATTNRASYDLSREASRDDLKTFIQREIEHSIEFLADDYWAIAAEQAKAKGETTCQS